jgi:hypothetical protein
MDAILLTGLILISIVGCWSVSLYVCREREEYIEIR